jgi:hypothetical protein
MNLDLHADPPSREVGRHGHLVGNFQLVQTLLKWLGQGKLVCCSPVDFSQPRGEPPFDERERVLKAVGIDSHDGHLRRVPTELRTKPLLFRGAHLAFLAFRDVAIEDQSSSSL